MDDAAEGHGVIEAAVASRPMPGFRTSGDLAYVHTTATAGLVAVVDALGHGPEAEYAATTAITTLRRDPGHPLPELVAACHRPLVGTRGVVIALARFEGRAGALDWTGVGNVDGLLVHSPATGARHRHRLVTANGFLGAPYPEIGTRRYPIAPGDLLILATDGIDRGFADTPSLDLPPQVLADELLRRFALESDDALVLVARYRGPGG